MHNRVESAAIKARSESGGKNVTKPENFLDWAAVQVKNLELKQAQQVQEHFDSLKNQNTSQDKFRIWDSLPYFDIRRFGLKQILDRLRVDIETLYDEYAGMFHRKEYKEWGLYGLHDAYNKKATEICEDFVRQMESLADQGMKSGRAKLEAWAAKALEQFLTNPAIPIGAVLILFSPRGKLDEAYPGDNPENYVFINAFVKTAHASNEPTPPGKNKTYPACFHQFTSYALTPQLLQQHAQMLHNFAPVPGFTTKIYQANKFLEHIGLNQPPFDENSPAEHWLIGHPILVIPEKKWQFPLTSNSYSQANPFTFSDAILEQIDHILYENQKNLDGTDWAIKISDLPEVDIVAFEEISQKITDRLVLVFEEFFTEHFNSLDNQSRQNTIQKSAQDFDQLVAIFRDYLLKWVEINDAHKNHTALNQTLPDIDHIIQIWRNEKNQLIQNQQEATPTSEKKDTLQGLQNQIVLQSSLLKKLASSAHCILNPGKMLGKAAQLPMSAAGKMQNKLQFGRLISKNLSTTVFSSQNKQTSQETFSTKNIQESNAAMETLTALQNRHSQLRSIKSALQPLEIYNYQKKRLETMYVAFTDSKYFSQYNRQCYKVSSNGPVLGPCHIDLNEDGLLLQIPLKNSQNRYLEQDQYNNLTQEIFELEMQLILQSALINQLQKSGKNNTSLDKNDIEKINHITKSLSSKIFRITFSDLVAGVVDYTDEFLTLPGKCISFLNSYGQNKLGGVHKLLLILEENDIATILKALQIAV